MSIHIHVLSVMSNGNNGHYAVNFRVVEDTPDGEITGPIETHGIEGLALSRLYGDVDLDSAITLWIEHKVKPTLIANYRTHAKISHTLGSMVGTKIPVDVGL